MNSNSKQLPKSLPGFYFDPQKNKYFPLINGKPPPHLRDVRPSSPPPRARSPDRPPSPPPLRTLPPSSPYERILQESGQVPRSSSVARRIFQSMSLYGVYAEDIHPKWSGEGLIMDASADREHLWVVLGHKERIHVQQWKLKRSDLKAQGTTKNFTEHRKRPKHIVALSCSPSGFIAVLLQDAPLLQDDAAMEQKIETYTSICHWTATGGFFHAQNTKDLPKGHGQGNWTFAKAIASHPKQPLYALCCSRRQGKKLLVRLMICHQHTRYSRDTRVKEIEWSDRRRNRQPGQITNLCFSNDGRMLAISSEYQVQILDISRMETEDDLLDFFSPRSPPINTVSTIRTEALILQIASFRYEIHPRRTTCTLLVDTPDGVRTLTSSFGDSDSANQSYLTETGTLIDMRRAQGKSGTSVRPVAPAISRDGLDLAVVKSELSGAFEYFAGGEKVHPSRIRKTMESFGKVGLSRVVWAKSEGAPILVFSGDESVEDGIVRRIAVFRPQSLCLKYTMKGLEYKFKDTDNPSEVWI